MTQFMRKNALVLALATASSCAATFASAAPPVGDASAYDFSVHVNLIVTQLDVPAQTHAAIVESSENSEDSQQANSLTIADPLNLIKLNSGLLTAQAQYVVGGLSAIAAQSSVEGLDLSAVGLGNIHVLSVLASTLTSRSVLMGSCPPPPSQHTSGLLDEFVFFNGFDEGNLTIGDDIGGGGTGGLPGSGAEFGDLQIKILGTPIVNLPPVPPPNTAIDLSVLGIAGATLVLNERTVEGDGVNSLSLSTNALHLTLNVVGLVTADVIVGHSDASLRCL